MNKIQKRAIFPLFQVQLMKENVEKASNSEGLAWVNSSDDSEATYFRKDNAIALQVLFLFPILANNKRLHATRLAEGSPQQTGLIASKQSRFCLRLFGEK